MNLKWHHAKRYGLTSIHKPTYQSDRVHAQQSSCHSSQGPNSMTQQGGDCHLGLLKNHVYILLHLGHEKKG